MAELDRLIAAGLRCGSVLADAGYGEGAAFRRGLSKRCLSWAAGIPGNQKLYRADVQLVPPGGRKRRPVPGQGSGHAPNREADAVLAGLPWRRVTWRQGTKGPLTARFAAARIRVGDGAIWANNRQLPGEEVWLVASGARAASASTPSPTCRLGARCGAWPLPSRRAGAASRHTNNSSKSSAWATSRADPAPACTGTR